MVHIYPWFKFHLPLFLGKLMHWNNLHVKREGLHHILESLKKDVLSDVCNISAFAGFTCLFFPITDKVFRLPFNLSD